MSLTIYMQNWMVHKDTEIAIGEPVAFIVGRNGSGKTAIRDAMEYAFLGTGQLRGIGSKKTLAQLSITEGQTKCSVRITMPLVRIEREMTRDGTQTIKRSSRSDIHADWPAMKRHPIGQPLLEDVDDVLRVVLEPTAFWTMDPRKRREMLIQATSEAGQTEKAILEAMRSYLRPEDKDDEDAILGMAKLAAADGFRSAEEQAGEERRDAKRQLKDLDLREPDFSHIEPDLLVAFGKNSLDQFETKLRDLRERHTKAVLGEGISTTAIEGRLQEAVDALEKLEDGDGEAADKTAAEDAKDRVDARVAGTKALEAACADVKAVEERMAAYGKVAPDSIFKKPTKCPAVSFEMKCPVKTATFEKHKPQLAAPRSPEKARAEQEALFATAKEVEMSARDALSVLQSDESRALIRAQEEIERKAREDAHMQQITDGRARKEEIEGELLEARKQSKDLNGSDSAAELHTRIEKGEDVVSLRREWEVASDAYAANMILETILGVQITRWDEIAKALKPDGIETKLGGGAREAFLDAIGQASVLTGHVDLNEEFELSVTIQSQKYHPLQLSTSQRLGVGIAIQHAMAVLIEFPVLLVDAIDLFDPERRSCFASFAKMVAPQYPGAVVGLATLGASKPVAPPPGFETFILARDEPIVHMKQKE